MQLSRNFSLAEFVASPTAMRLGIENVPTERDIENLRMLCVCFLQPLRDILGYPVYINSGFRCAELNRAVNGAVNSQHMKGEASDTRTEVLTARELYGLIIKKGLEFDQLILYPSFVHVSYHRGGNRMQNLYAKGVAPC
jgi:hypothetical protein